MTSVPTSPLKGFGVQAFVMAKRGLAPEPPRSATSREGALRLGERLAPGKAGVLVVAWQTEPGEDAAIEILATHGRVPPELLEQLAA